VIFKKIVLRSSNNHPIENFEDPLPEDIYNGKVIPQISSDSINVPPTTTPLSQQRKPILVAQV